MEHFKLPAAATALLVSFPVTYVTKRVASAFRSPAESGYISKLKTTIYAKKAKKKVPKKL
ncbi:hypothetical protein [Alkalihalobacillus sp. TS-13]|uniref:hypothetical protein n=1 Tax=Alkalihalobacillus sp. TS-13 TaxID=2842455 RepID=UPI001C885BFB|nr:hypothetical protein [Alkalihalobacillus sp. TS-13]